MKSPTRHPITKFAALATALALSATSALAADATWTNTANGAWTNPAMWNPGAAPGSTNVTTSPDTAYFNDLTISNITVTVDNNRNISNIVVSNAGAFSYTIGAGSFKLTSGGSLQLTTASNNLAISTPIIIQGDGGTAAFTVNATSAFGLRLSGAVSGASTAGNTTTITLNGTSTSAQNYISSVISDGTNGGKVALVKDGSGTWQLQTGTATNTFSGGVTINAGTLNIAKASALGTGTLTINSGTLAGGLSGGTNTISGTVINGDFTSAITSAMSLGTGTVSLGTAAGTTRAITGSTSQLAFDGTIIDGTTANKLATVGNNNNWALNASNSFTGGVTFGRGTLTLGNANALGTGALTLTSDSTSMVLNVTDGLTIANSLVLSNAVMTGGTGNVT